MLRAVLQERRFRRDLRHGIVSIESADVRVARLKSVLEQSLKGELGPQESTWVASIERRRRELLVSREPLLVTDFGAGVAADQYSESEQRAGVSSTITVGEACRASKPKPWASLLLRLTREFRPTSILEMGTCVGISGSYIAAAMTINGAGHLYTLEGAESVADVARRTFGQLGLSALVDVITGPFHRTLKPTLEKVGTIDMIFVDGHHDGPATVRYFETVKPHLSESAIVVFDDLTWSDGMAQAWKTISADSTLRQAIGLGAMGIALS